jgi:hypothetical protein
MAIVPIKEHQKRRETFLKKLEPDSIAIIPSAPECPRNGDR